MQKMQLFGSTTSPYVRRLRLYMHEIPHDFVLIDIFNSRDRANIQAQNPTLKIPMLKDDEQILLDSGLIFRYLVEKFDAEPLTWDQQNILACIDAASESLVQLLVLSRSEIDTSADKLYFRIQRAIVGCFTHLEQKAEENAFEQWNYLSISLFCLLDWVLFRNLHDISKYSQLIKLHDNWNQLAICHLTDPRG